MSNPLPTISFWVSVRQERDLRLKNCDWTQMPDTALTDSKKTEWATYRQALRDVPANNTSASNFEGVTWPTEPS